MVTIILVSLSVRLSVWNSSAPTGQIFVKFYIDRFFYVLKSVERSMVKIGQKQKTLYVRTYIDKLDMCLSVHRCICVGKKNQLDATEWFIALIICSTCFGHFYAHRQELETICVLLPPMVSSAWLLVVVQHPSCWTHSLLPCTCPRQPATKHWTP